MEKEYVDRWGASSSLLLASASHAAENTYKYGIAMIDIPTCSFLMGSSSAVSKTTELQQRNVHVKVFRWEKLKLRLDS